MKPFYITTPIYYVTDVPHIGHLYTTTAADIMARYHRLLGEKVFFLTGTDEHGQKIQKKAKENNETPQQLADRVVERYKEAWIKFNIQYDDFIRTTEERHKKVVTEYVAKLMQTGDIYLDTYEGWYCVPDETYLTETQVVDGKCPDCGRVVEKLKEESYFFKMSKYQEQLKEHIERNPTFIQPESRKNEVLGFIKQGLRDISVSRTTIEWGIPMPADSNAKQTHKIYVWFDALTNYISALDPKNSNSKFKEYWPEAIHLVGKDILKFHAVYWPTFLMALKLPLPKQIWAHGWLTNANKKIGKSVGNAVNPMALADNLGIDAIRYFLFREFVFGLDGEYTETSLYQRINSDLANDFGNALSRVTNMVLKYFGDEGLEVTKILEKNSDLKTLVTTQLKNYHESMHIFAYNKALESLWVILSAVNKSIEDTAPWKLAKDPSHKEALKEYLIIWLECIRVVSTCLMPFMPTSSEKALKILGESTISKNALTLLKWGNGLKKIKVTKPEPLFPRHEIPKNE